MRPRKVYTEKLNANPTRESEWRKKTNQLADKLIRKPTTGVCQSWFGLHSDRESWQMTPKRKWNFHLNQIFGLVFFLRFLLQPDECVSNEITCFALCMSFSFGWSFLFFVFVSLLQTHTHREWKCRRIYDTTFYSSRLCVDISVAHFIAIFWHRNNASIQWANAMNASLHRRAAKSSRSQTSLEYTMYCIVPWIWYIPRSTQPPAHHHQQSGMRLFIFVHIRSLSLSYFRSHLHGVLVCVQAIENKRLNNGRERREWKKKIGGKEQQHETCYDNKMRLMMWCVLSSPTQYACGVCICMSIWFVNNIFHAVDWHRRTTFGCLPNQKQFFFRFVRFFAPLFSSSTN